MEWRRIMSSLNELNSRTYEIESNSVGPQKQEWKNRVSGAEKGEIPEKVLPVLENPLRWRRQRYVDNVQRKYPSHPSYVRGRASTKYVLQVRYLESKMISACAFTQAWLLNGFCSPFHSFSEVYIVVTLVKSICPYGVTSVLLMMVHKTLQTQPMCHNFIPHSLEN